MEHEFDRVVTKTVGEEKLEYGFIFGNEKIVFIKVGVGQDIRKYQDHFNIYIEAAKRAHEFWGATVICASNPDVPHEDIDEKAIRWAASNQGHEEFKLYLWGMFDGAYKNLSLARKFTETVKFIGLNTSFISFDSFEQKLQALPRVKKFLIYGTEDDEYDVVFPTLRDKQNDYLKTIFVGGADHRFTGLPLPIIYSMNLIEDDEAKKEVVSFGHYWVGTGMENVPIDWLVLEETEEYLFLVSKQSIVSKPYANDDDDTWEKSSIRKWLNDKFLTLAFNDHEREWIVETKNTTFYDSYFDLPELTVNSADKVFLLDFDTFNRHFTTMESTIAEQSRYAIETLKESGGYEFLNDWWLRNGGDCHNPRLILGNGFSEGFGSSKGIAGIRPAMYIRRNCFEYLPLEGQLSLFDEEDRL